MTIRAVLAASATFWSCFGPGYVVRSGHVGVDVQTQAEWAHAPDLRHRIERVLDLSARRWGGDVPRDLSGWMVVLVDGGIECFGFTGMRGCTNVLTKTILVRADNRPCIEMTSLAHEIGHAIHLDPFHHSPAWRDVAAWQALQDDLMDDPQADCSPWVASGQRVTYMNQWAP